MPSPMPAAGVKAPNYALWGSARWGATRWGYVSPKVYVSVNGVQRAFGRDDAHNRIRDLSITLTSSAEPNRATFTAVDWDVRVGMPVIITIGSKDRHRRLFAGTVLTVVEGMYEKPANRIWTITCVDWTWTATRTPVNGRFTGTADAIALELMATYAPVDFTTTQVETGLPTVQDGIEFTNEDLPAALQRLAKRVNAQTRFDYHKDLYFRKTPLATATNPRTLTPTLKSLKHFSIRRDMSQQFNVVCMEGGGASCLSALEADEVVIPVDDVSWYETDCGIRIGPQRFNFFDYVDEGGYGTVVGTGARPLSPPVLALAAGSGVTAGTHKGAVTFVTAAGESIPSPLAEITTGTVPAPETAVAAVVANGDGLDAGEHTWYPVFRTAAGSTTPGPVSNAITATAGQTKPTMPAGGFSSPYTWEQAGPYSGGPLLSGHTYLYKIGWQRNSDGKLTDPSSATSPTFTVAGGNAYGGLRADSITVPAGYSPVLYRQKDAAGSFMLCGDVRTQPSVVAGAIVYYLRDFTQEADLGVAAPSANETIQGVANLTGIPVSPDALVTNVDLYRSFNGGTAKYALTVANGTTTATDTVPNASRGADIPGSNTAAAGQFTATLPLGPTGTTGRKFYMTVAGGSQLKLQSTTSDNTTPSVTVATADGSLGANAPTSDTSGLTQPAGYVLVGESTLPVAINAFPIHNYSNGIPGGADAYGWVRCGSQLIRYTGISGNTLTGIPATGIGSIKTSIPYNTPIDAPPQIIGLCPVFQNVAQGLYDAVPSGTSFNVFVTETNIDAEEALGDALGEVGAVAREHWLNGDRRMGAGQLRKRCRAFLDLRAFPQLSAEITSTDVNCEPGRTLTIALTAPTSVSEAIEIKSVTLTQMLTGKDQPLRTVEASSELFTLIDLIGAS